MAAADASLPALELESNGKATKSKHHKKEKHKHSRRHKDEKRAKEKRQHNSPPAADLTGAAAEVLEVAGGQVSS